MALKTAKYYIKCGKPGHARETTQLIELEERLRFYKQENWIVEVVELLQANRRLPELYRYLKGNNRFEDGANIAYKFKNFDDHFCFVLMDIKQKSLNPDFYTDETKSQDIKTLTKFQGGDVDCILAILGCDAQKCLILHEKLEGYRKAEVFNMYVNALQSNPERMSIRTVFKNLRHLLHIYKSNSDGPRGDMIKHFHVEIQNEDEYWVPPLTLHMLGSTEPKKKKHLDLDGMLMLTEGQLKSLFTTKIKSIAKTWLEMLHKVVEKENESSVTLSEQRLFWAFLSKHALRIEYRYYLEQFGFKFETTGDGTPCSATQMLLSMLNLEWICYIPIGHPEVQSNFIKDITDPRTVVSKVFKQTKLPCMNIQGFLEQWMFQGSTKRLKFYYKSFSEFAADTIQMYREITESDNPNIDRIVSELEVVTIGLLGIVSQLEGHWHKVILPQSNCYWLIQRHEYL